MKTTTISRSIRRVRRGNPRLEEQIHDPYRNDRKLHSPVKCSQCGVVFSRGRWTWLRVRAPQSATPCPACRRINDGYPAGELAIDGSFVSAHAHEIESIVRNVEAAETAEHPLHRVMKIERRPASITVTTTDIHLPRRIGHALESAWHGELATHYDEQGYFARVHWHRDA